MSLSYLFKQDPTRSPVHVNEICFTFAPCMINRKQAPAIHDPVDFNYILPACNKETAPNGIPIYWLNAGSQEVVQVEWVFRAGLWNEEKTAVAQAVASLLKNGTATRSSLEINEAIEFYGASLKVSVNNDFAFVTLHTLTRYLPKLLPVIKEVILEPAFPQGELAVFVQNALQRLSVNLLQSDFVANRHIDAMVFGADHPYGRYTTAEALQSLSCEDLLAHHRRNFRSDECLIFMAGSITAADVKLVEDAFGKESWNTESPKAEKSFVTHPDTQKVKRLVNDEKSVQGAVREARSFVTRSHPDFAPMIVLNTLFGGYFGSRLMANIREEKGYTYGIYSYLYPTRHAGAMMVSTEAGRDVCEQTVEEIYKEMKLLRDQPVGDEELLLVKNYLLGNILGDLDGPFSIIQRWKNLILNGLPAAQFDTNIRIYKSITPEALHELANRYLKEEDFYNLVVV